jgi:hypothetical protein
MKISLFYESPPDQGLTEARRGKELFYIFSYQSAAGAAAFILTGSIEVTTLSSYMDYPIFIVPV